MRHITRVTYGEAYTERSFSMQMKNGDFEVKHLASYRSRMDKATAGKYYTDKINKVMGWK